MAERSEFGKAIIDNFPELKLYSNTSRVEGEINLYLDTPQIIITNRLSKNCQRK